MATPMTAAQLIAQLKKWDVPFKEYREWEQHNRGNRGTGWGPVNGFMVHHTGSDGKDQRELLYEGTRTLPGPLSQFGLAQDGTVHLIGWGRCNHAGLGDPDVLDAVINENYGAHPPLDNQSTVDGNSRFYGVEIWYSGEHGMSPSQYGTLLKLSAAVLDFHKWSEKSVIAHGEWQPGKWDPGYKPGAMMDMSAVRSDIGRALRHEKPEPNPKPKPKPKPVPKPSPETPESKTQAYRDVMENDVVPVPDWWPTKKTNPTWNVVSYLRTTLEMVKEIRDIVREIRDRG